MKANNHEKKSQKTASKKVKSGNSKTSDSMNDDKTLHTTNPFTGKKTDIKPRDLENIKKWSEAQTERD